MRNISDIPKNRLDMGGRHLINPTVAIEGKLPAAVLSDCYVGTKHAPPGTGKAGKKNHHKRPTGKIMPDDIQIISVNRQPDRIGCGTGSLDQFIPKNDFISVHR